MKTQRITLPIYDLSCGGGALIVERTLAKVPGVARVYVNPATEMAYVQYDPTVVEAQQLIHAVRQAGFRVGQPSQR